MLDTGSLHIAAHTRVTTTRNAVAAAAARRTGVTAMVFEPQPT